MLRIEKLLESELKDKFEGYQYRWKHEEEQRPIGFCYDCRMEYSKFPDLIIPDRLWERINPTNIKGAGVLCPTCIARRLEHLGLWYGNVILIEI